MRSTTTAADSAQTLSRPASFFSKVATPFTSRKRNLAEFYIETDEPYRQYSPADKVKGCVNIKVEKAINITHLAVCLHGYVKVFSNAKIPGQSVPRDGAPLGTGNGTSKKGAEYFGNGFASLFEDEVVLCGQGRLLPGAYKFRFELELPSKSLPTSIDFERGTISYMLTSTLTRPTTISPRTSCHWKIKFVEIIDVAWSQQPKPQVVSLEPIVKGHKSKSSTKQSVANGGAQQGPQYTPESAVAWSSGDPPRSPAPSETSSTSAASSGGFNWQIRSSASIAKSVFGEIDYGRPGGISARIEVLRGGCLPGDLLPVQITVHHTKAVKNLQGVIVTLYRSARVDTHPAIPLGPETKDKKPEYEDYYPKSRTGLGGLSLSSAGSSRAFRQDLNQTFAPLILDPQSLTAIIKTSLQVPEDLFPTINNVPGQMISFKYYVEVVVDLRGKLASPDRVRSQLGIVNGAGGYGHGDPQVNGVDGSSGLFFPLASGFGCLDTSQIRREKSVVSWPFEMVVGTRDSDRKRCKQSDSLPTSNSAVVQQSMQGMDNGGAGSDADRGQQMQPAAFSPYRSEPDGFFQIPQHLVSSPQYTEAAQLTIIPPPEEEPDDGDEKERLKRAEQRLLPSEPPVTDEDSSRTLQPSAPEAIDDEDFVNRYRMYRPTSQFHSPMSQETIVPISSQNNEAMEAGSPSIIPASFSESNDGKQDLEMQGLQEQISCPSAAQGTPTPLEFTVPNIVDDTLQDTPGTPADNGQANGSGLLPMYRK